MKIISRQLNLKEEGKSNQCQSQEEGGLLVCSCSVLYSETPLHWHYHITKGRQQINLAPSLDYSSL
jgi:hypothetical protein